MFSKANLGIVAWPVTMPVDTNGNVAETKIHVRLRIRTRAEQREYKSRAVKGTAARLQETLQGAEAIPEGATPAEAAAAQEARARRMLEQIDQIEAEVTKVEDADIADLRARLVAYLPPDSSDYVEFTADALDDWLAYRITTIPLLKALNEASDGAPAGN